MWPLRRHRAASALIHARVRLRFIAAAPATYPSTMIRPRLRLFLVLHRLLSTVYTGVDALSQSCSACLWMQVRIERHALAVSIASNAWNPQQQSLSNARQRAAQPADAAARCLAASQPSSHTQTQHAKTQPSIALPRISAPALEMPEHGVPHMRSPVGSLPSKELFAAPAPAAPTIGYGGAPAVGMAVGSPRALEAPASVDSSLWGASPAQAPAFNLCAPL
eukprot:1594616-Pleurochrysis_carterae.AAC.1